IASADSPALFATWPSRTNVANTLQCPYPLRVNPHADLAEKNSQAWVRRFYGESPLAARAARARMSIMVAGFYPTCSQPALFLACDFLRWAFILDDLGDETRTGHNPDALEALFAAFDAVLAGDTPSPSQAPPIRALADIVERLSVYGDETLKRFAVGNREYF